MELTWRTPDWWQFALLSLAAFRVYRLVARDTITAPVREAVSYPDDATVELGEKPSEVEVGEQRVQLHRLTSLAPDERVVPTTDFVVVGDDEQPKTWRVYLSTLLRCPWCAGFYVSVAAWGLWVAWPTPALFVAAPLAVSAVVALLEKNLDA